MRKNSIFNKIRRRLVFAFAKYYSDRRFLEILFPINTGNKLNLDNPQTYNEKLQWLKLYDRKSEYTDMVDKIEAKKYVASLIGEEYIIPTLAIYDKVEDIDFDSLPEKFVLKCTHDSGGIVICKDKKDLNKKAAIKKLKKGLKRNYYYKNREWPYKHLKPRIICEEYMVDESGYELKDYKFFCFNGKVKFFKIDFGRFIEHHANYYSPDGILLDFGEKDFPPNPNYRILLPSNLDVMIRLAEKLAHNIPFIRVDLYNIDRKIYFGELTFFPASGLGKWSSKDVDRTIGEYLILPSRRIELH